MVQACLYLYEMQLERSGSGVCVCLVDLVLFPTLLTDFAGK